MNSISKYLVVALLSLLQLSCYKDNSTQDTRTISDIQVAFDDAITPVVNLDRGEVLTVDPIISQTEKDKPLTYEWQVNYEVVSNERKLNYTGAKLGSFYVRLKVSNEDGSTFNHFTLNVNSAYEEGLMLLGEDEQGEGTLAFMRTFSPAEIAAGRVESFATNCFAVNNPGLKLGKGPTDIKKRLNQVFISSRDEKKIYLLNTKTFELEATITASDIPGFKPLKMNIPDNASRTAFILCDGGSIYKLALIEYLISQDNKLPNNVMEKTDFGSSLNDTYNYFWEASNSTLRQFSAYYTTSSLNEFSGQDLIQFFYAEGSLYVITTDPVNPGVYTKTVFSNYIQNVSTKQLDILQKSTLTSTGAPTLNSNAITEVNALYKKLLYAEGNKIYSWVYTGTDMPSDPFITISAGNITSLTQSPDGRKLYVGVYNPAAAGLKGSVYIYNMDTGALISKYENVADKPVKLFYKKKD